jgi:hypothetical protein
VPDEIQLEVFRTGDYGPKGVYTEQDLETIASDYNPADHEAPVTLDHEQKGPAHGWVSALRRTGDRLVATLTRLSPTLAEALRSGAFKKRSIELYRQFDATGRPYFKALTFLGAGTPEVKGLADPHFAAEIDVLRFDHAESPDHASAARTRLIQAGVWKPEWEAAGLLDVFSKLAAGPEAISLLAFLEGQKPPVELGAAGVSRDVYTSNFADDVVGGASAESRCVHEAAVAVMQANPGITYREALLITGASRP